MSNDKKGTGEVIEGHEYDGIQELDHPLPKWWVNLFYATIVFAVGYYAYYEFLGGPTHEEQYEAAMQAVMSKRAAVAKTEAAAPVKEVSVEDLMKDEKALAVGEATFKQSCAACHGANGEGVIGPNLTDKHWIYSKGDFDGVMKAILVGFPEKGMPAWKELIPQAKHAPLAVYVLKLQGTNPANGKAPQGDLIN